jgi:hypothetical protein
MPHVVVVVLLLMLLRVHQILHLHIQQEGCLQG